MMLGRDIFSVNVVNVYFPYPISVIMSFSRLSLYSKQIVYVTEPVLKCVSTLLIPSQLLPGTVLSLVNSHSTRLTMSVRQGKLQVLD